MLSGHALATLPIVPARVVPDIASPGIEGWTVTRPDGKGEWIFIYTETVIFRWRERGENHECLPRLASVIVHEARRFHHGAEQRRRSAWFSSSVRGRNG